RRRPQRRHPRRPHAGRVRCRARLPPGRVRRRPGAPGGRQGAGAARARGDGRAHGIGGMTLLATGTPIRQPDSRRPDVMQRRGWWLVVIGFLLPGSAQTLAGSKRLGRIGLVATGVLLMLLAIAGVLWFAARGALITIVGN